MTLTARQDILWPMTGTGKITYGRAVRLRVALAELAAKIADTARGMVPAYADRSAHGGDFVEGAHQLAAQARELLTLAVAYERCRGTSWEAIGAPMSVSKQSAHERFSVAASGLDDALTAAWLLGDNPRHPADYGCLPEGATDPATVAGRLDWWVIRHMQQTDVLTQQDAGTRARPVSAGLEPIGTLEQSAMVTHGANLISDRLLGTMPDDPARRDPETRALEIGLARRKIELYEQMQDTVVHGPARADEIADLLAGARARLADLEATASKDSAA